MTIRTIGACFALGVLVAGCAASQPTLASRLADAERVRAGVPRAEGLPPEVLARGDAALEAARQAANRGDDVTAGLHAEHALALYTRASVLARLRRASAEDVTATTALDEAKELRARYSQAHAATDKEVDDLEKQLRIAREARLPAASRPADASRERARAVAARSLATQAHLLCGAAKLVSTEAPGLKDAEATLTRMGRDPGVDAAAHARVECLSSLTKARRGANATFGSTDTLLAELSQATSTEDGGGPWRDERGVVVTLRNLFQGDALAPGMDAKLTDLGRVAAAHPSFPLQIVFHSAQAGALNRKHSSEVVRLLQAGGAAAGKIQVEDAGARAPVVDPNDAKRRGLNARVEIVFVSPEG